MVTTILEAIDLVGKWCGALAAVLVFGIAILIVAEIVSRAFLGISLSFAWEFSAYFFAASVFLGAAYTMHTGGHVRVALFRGMLSERGQSHHGHRGDHHRCRRVWFLAYSLVVFAWRSFERGSVSPTIDETPLAIPQAAIAFGATLFALNCWPAWFGYCGTSRRKTTAPATNSPSNDRVSR